jgi:hypothetical protein
VSARHKRRRKAGRLAADCSLQRRCVGAAGDKTEGMCEGAMKRGGGQDDGP